ncbi:hypothetical protein TI39_contig4116g00010 [Zymoseptoria brevis]|uniref:Hydrophobin like protein n=1 Tax=Zymoseptoria brevis TaxID=1047168 RepID=A0A0F4GGN9_9PEZI|nr:hypothetical protein TI39_contig4116g00010 [Zymoseptoria brevis]
MLAWKTAIVLCIITAALADDLIPGKCTTVKSLPAGAKRGNVYGMCKSTLPDCTVIHKACTMISAHPVLSRGVQEVVNICLGAANTSSKGDQCLGIDVMCGRMWYPISNTRDGIDEDPMGAVSPVVLHPRSRAAKVMQFSLAGSQ